MTAPGFHHRAAKSTENAERSGRRGVPKNKRRALGIFGVEQSTTGAASKRQGGYLHRMSQCLHHVAELRPPATKFRTNP